MEVIQGLIILTVGLVSGFLNTVAGGGSLISLPVLIFMGLPSSIANATNRVAIFSQNIFAVSGFKSKGVFTFPYSLWLGIAALFGAILGAKIAVDIEGELFNKILAVIMLLVMAWTIFNPLKRISPKEEKLGLKHYLIAIPAFFLIGIYGGFIQAGVGFLIMAALTSINGFNLVKTNSIKVFVVLIYTLAALVVFILEDQINWLYGIVLAIGNSAGGWFASRWSVEKGDVWIKRILIITVIAFSIRLWFFS